MQKAVCLPHDIGFNLACFPPPASPALNDETAAPSIPASPTAETAVRSAGSPAANVETAEAVTEAAAETAATAAATTEAATESGATAMVNDTAAQPAAGRRSEPQ